jgi:hypothetical protein
MSNTSNTIAKPPASEETYPTTCKGFTLREYKPDQPGDFWVTVCKGERVPQIIATGHTQESAREALAASLRKRAAELRADSDALAAAAASISEIGKEPT